MSISIEQAMATAVALRSAAETPNLIHGIREELTGRAEEWERAAAHCADLDGEGIIISCTAVNRGMRVANDRFGYCRVLKKINDGLSLMMESPDSPQGWWRNFLDPTSPVVVRA